MKTQTDKTTASAPETRTHAEMANKSCSASSMTFDGHCMDCGWQEPSKRTIPAEKPTAIHTEAQLQEHVDALKWSRDNEKILAWQRDEARKHADKLAEALRHLLAITRNDNANQYKASREALAAYEGAQ